MAAIETVKSATETETDADDSLLSPTQTAPLRKHVYVTLEFVGVDFDPSDLYDGLNDKFGTVATNKVNARGHYSYVIST